MSRSDWCVRGFGKAHRHGPGTPRNAPSCGIWAPGGCACSRCDGRSSAGHARSGDSSGLADLGSIDSLVDRTERVLGPIDVLMTNAGVEIAASFTQLTRQELTSMVNLNLTAPLLLTHRVLPGKLERHRGHVVFVSSEAGKFGPAYQAPYAVTKAALIGLNQSLRADYAAAPIGFSVLCPGFIAGDGMYQRMVGEGARSNRLLGETTVEKAATKVLEAIQGDLPRSSRPALRSAAPCTQPIGASACRACCAAVRRHQALQAVCRQTWPPRTTLVTRRSAER